MVKNADSILSGRTLPDGWLLPVLNNLNTPPTNKTDGDRYRVTSVATGAWSGKENNIAIWDAENSKWQFYALVEPNVWYDMTAHDWHYMSNAGVITQFDKIPLAISDVTGLQAALDAKASTSHQSTHQSGQSDALTGDIDANARLDILANSVDIGKRRKLNLIAGTNITISAVENVGAESIEATINSTASITTTFDDSIFDIFNHADPTKIVKVDASKITTGTTKTLSAQDASGTISLIDVAETWTETKTSSKNGDVLIPSVDGQGNVGNDTHRLALVRAVVVSSGDLILSDRKTGKVLYVIHEDKRGIYFSDHKTGKTKMFLDMKNGNLKITGKIIENAKIAKTFKKIDSSALKRNLRGSRT